MVSNTPVSSMRKMGGGGGPPPPPKPSREGGSSGASGSSGAPPATSKKPKMAPMMAKTLKMVRGLKVNFRRWLFCHEKNVKEKRVYVLKKKQVSC